MTIKGTNDIKHTTFTEICNNWLIYVKRQHKLSTYDKYKNIVTKYLTHTSNDAGYSDEISLQKIIDKSWDEKQPSESTVRSIRCVLSQIADFGNIDLDCESLEYLPYDQNHLSRRFEVSVLSLRQQRKLVKELLHDIDAFKIGILICLYTGLRLGELCALENKDISISDKKISINKTVQRLAARDKAACKKTELIISDPKTKSSYRDVPICEFLYSVLKNNISDSQFFLCGNKPADPRRIQYKFKRYQEQISLTSLNFHSLRHTFATNCIAGGMDPKTLSEILGHADVKTTLNRYVHPSLELKRKQLNKCIRQFPVVDV